MGEKRNVSVDGEEFEVDGERDGDAWKVQVGGREFSIQVDRGGPSEVTRGSTCLLYTSPSPRDRG